MISDTPSEDARELAEKVARAYWDRLAPITSPTYSEVEIAARAIMADRASRTPPVDVSGLVVELCAKAADRAATRLEADGYHERARGAELASELIRNLGGQP